MADVRALLAAERQSRRIQHPLLTYTKSGQLLCNVCNLNVKSEALWNGHLRSANHRKNTAKAVEEKSSKNLKRKIEDVQEPEEDGPMQDEGPREMKKPKSRAVSHAEHGGVSNGQNVEGVPERPMKSVRFDVQEETPEDAPEDGDARSRNIAKTVDTANLEDDEMAAFERDIATLERQPDYSAATITSAPISAAQLEEQHREDRRKQQELEAEDEIDEEGRKLEEEFEVMEELEERVNKLKERREALRSENTQATDSELVAEALSIVDEKQQEEEGSDDEEVDDWYG